MKDLPVDAERGYPIPWFVHFENGKHDFRVLSPDSMEKAILENRCWVCGKRLYSEKVFVSGPMFAVNRISGEPPSHRECALYSATACPFLTKPQMVRNEHNRPDGVVVNEAMHERNPGVTLLWYTRRYRLLHADGGVLFDAGAPFRWEWYAKGRIATRAEVLEGLESGVALLRDVAEKDGPDALEELDRRHRVALRFVPRA
jgi:hypothetical protein